MVFSNTTTNDGAIQQIEANTSLGLGNITGNSDLFDQFTAQYNNYYMKATSNIVMADGIWVWDDTNQSDLPNSVTDLVENQADYQVLSASPSSNQDWLDVIGVNVKDTGGKWYRLKYKAEKNFGSPRQERETVASQPNTYSLKGTQVFLDSKPNYSSSGGIEIEYNRAGLIFTVADTTKRPGFHTLYHEYMVLGCTYWWEKYKGVGNPEQTKRDLTEMENAMQKHYNNRHKYEPNMIQRPPSQTRRGYR